MARTGTLIAGVKEIGTVTFPSEFVMAFNPIVVSVKTGSGRNYPVVVTMTNKETKANYIFNPKMYAGEVDFHVERFVQRLFDEKQARSMEFEIRVVVVVGNDIATTNMSSCAVWGSLLLGERLPFGGVYNDVEGCYERRLQWFKHYPFTVSMMMAANGNVDYRYDGVGYVTLSSSSGVKVLKKGVSEIYIPSVEEEVGYLEYGRSEFHLPRDVANANTQVVLKAFNNGKGGVEPGVFDMTFDDTFKRLAKDTLFVRLMVREEQEGVYLRWIDRHGFMQYYLFVEGMRQNVAKPSASHTGGDVNVLGEWFSGHERAVEVENTRKQTCCAVNLDEETFSYVETIVNSPVVDMYMGKRMREAVYYDNIWQPVIVNDVTVTRDPKVKLQDIEITLTLPALETQKL